MYVSQLEFESGQRAHTALHAVVLGAAENKVNWVSISGRYGDLGENTSASARPNTIVGAEAWRVQVDVVRTSKIHKAARVIAVCSVARREAEELTRGAR